MNSSVFYRSIEERLGPAEDRFFGGRFRAIERAVNRLRIDGQAVHATAGLRYPLAWSMKEHGSPRPHLSTLDVLAIMVDLAEAYLTHTLSLEVEERRRCWLCACDMHVTKSQEQLDEFIASAVVVSTSPVLGAAHLWRTTFECQIGTFSGHCVVEHEMRQWRAAGGVFGTAVELLGDPSERYHGDLYKARTQYVRDVRLDASRTAIEASVSVQDAPYGPDVDHGFAGAYQPSLGMIDAVVSLAQLAQTLTYELDGIARVASNTFWMRRLAMQRDMPREPFDAPLPAAVAITRTACRPRGDEVWRTLDVTGRIAGIRIEAAVAHQLPAGAAGSAH